MNWSFTKGRLKLLAVVALGSALAPLLMSSSHREAPMIAYDPQADNTDVYAFRNPTRANSVTIVANWIPAQLPWSGPNFYTFGENIRYEIHIDNDVTTPGDDITYRFTFDVENEDPSTFFHIRLGKVNQKTTYTMERSLDGGKSFQTLITKGYVPPYNVGDRSIQGKYGLAAASYNQLMEKAYMDAGDEKVFAGTIEDPFFVDLGGAFDLGDIPRTDGPPRDGLACLNVNSIVIDIPITLLQKDGKDWNQAKSILDPDFVIGVWASSSRRSMRVLNGDGTETHSGDWVQVSRLGMPLTNEVVIPIGKKDLWNAITPYQDLAYMSTFAEHFYNPELALYMDESKFAVAVPAFDPLRIQTKSLGQFDFRNGRDGLFPLKGSPALEGTALDEDAFGGLLLPGPGKPRSVDLWPIFHTGVPNMRPYQLATGKNGNPLAKGKPFIHNFLPNGGDMLRLNMATPFTKRDDPEFSSLGLIQAAVLGLTDPRFNTNTDFQFIPNMDGFPNGRRLEDDVTRIELQAVSGIVLAAIGLWYDDYVPGSSPVTQDLLDVLTYTTGVEKNDTAFKPRFPFVQTPRAGDVQCECNAVQDGSDDGNMQMKRMPAATSLNMSAPEMMLTTSPNPAASVNTVRYHLAEAAQVRIVVSDASGKPLKVLVNAQKEAGTHTLNWSTEGLPGGVYFINGQRNGRATGSVRVVKQ